MVKVGLDAGTAKSLKQQSLTNQVKQPFKMDAIKAENKLFEFLKKEKIAKIAKLKERRAWLKEMLD